MNTLKPETVIKLNALLADYKDRSDYNTAIEIALILSDEDYRFQAEIDVFASPPQEPRPSVQKTKAPAPSVKFLKTKYQGKCCRCSVAYQAQDWVFWTAGVGSWCPGCGTPEEKAQAGTYWTNYVKAQAKATDTNVVPFRKRA